MNLRATVEDWGLPEYFKGKDLILEYFCDLGSLKITDKEGNLKFEMDFICQGSIYRDSAISQKREEINLNYIHVVEPEDRKKGVASFYLFRLIELCKANEITTVTLCVARSSDTCNAIKNENCLKHEELIKFYEKHLGEDLILKISK